MELGQKTTEESKTRSKQPQDFSNEEAAELRKQPFVLGLSRNKKVLKYRTVSNGTPLYEIYFEDGGAVPDKLRGHWTTVRDMKKAVEMYEHSLGLTF